jgi:hypothetical protein
MNLKLSVGIINSFRRGVDIVEIKNIMEEFVFNHLDKMMSSDDNICKCEKCRMDVALC